MTRLASFVAEFEIHHRTGSFEGQEGLYITVMHPKHGTFEYFGAQGCNSWLKTLSQPEAVGDFLTGTAFQLAAAARREFYRPKLSSDARAYLEASEGW